MGRTVSTRACSRSGALASPASSVHSRSCRRPDASDSSTCAQRCAAVVRSVVHVRSCTLTRPATASSVLRATRLASVAGSAPWASVALVGQPFEVAGRRHPDLHPSTDRPEACGQLRGDRCGTIRRRVHHEQVDVGQRPLGSSGGDRAVDVERRGPIEDVDRTGRLCEHRLEGERNPSSSDTGNDEAVGAHAFDRVTHCRSLERGYVGRRTAMPGRSSKPFRSDVTTVRPKARAVAAMIRSWAPRGRPARRTATSRSVCARATSRSYPMIGTDATRSSTNARRALRLRPVEISTPTPSSAMVIAATAGSSSSAIRTSRSSNDRSASMRTLVSRISAVRTAPRP